MLLTYKNCSDMGGSRQERYTHYFMCSSCKYNLVARDSKFCQNCGEKIEFFLPKDEDGFYIGLDS